MDQGSAEKIYRARRGRQIVFLLIGIAATAAGAVLLWPSRPRDLAGRLFSLFYLALAAGFSLWTLWLLVTPPPTLTIAEDGIVYGGRRPARIAFQDLVVGDIEQRQRGRVIVTVFDLRVILPSGKLKQYEINAMIWPEFYEMHGRLRRAA
jgi:hypothetical protein